MKRRSITRKVDIKGDTKLFWICAKEIVYVVCVREREREREREVERKFMKVSLELLPVLNFSFKPFKLFFIGDKRRMYEKVATFTFL